MLTMAVNKGRVLSEAMNLLKSIGFVLDDLKDNRQLIYYSTYEDVRVCLLVVRGSDVITLLNNGKADLGIVGMDTLAEEASMTHFYMPLDLKISKCRLCIAALPEMDIDSQRDLVVATKFLNITKSYFDNFSQNIQMIKLTGAVEIAPILGLSDCIVDIVDSGNTLKANGLEIKREIMPISSHLIVNKRSLKLNQSLIIKIIDDLALLVN